MNRALRSFLLAGVCLALAWWLSSSGKDRQLASIDPATPVLSGTAPLPAGTPNGSVGFRTPDRLGDHFTKHGEEFGSISQAEYLRQAQMLRDALVSDSVLEIVRTTDGVVSRFDRRTGAFGAYDEDGTIRTFFKPNDGEAYFRRQARRAPS